MNKYNVITLAGGIIIVILGIMTLSADFFVLHRLDTPGLGSAFYGLGYWGIISIIIGGIISVLSMFAYKKGKNWIELGLIISVLSFILGLGLGIGPILSIIGTVLALKKVWKK